VEPGFEEAIKLSTCLADRARRSNPNGVEAFGQRGRLEPAFKSPLIPSLRLPARFGRPAFLSLRIGGRKPAQPVLPGERRGEGV
jgi:hypothetical protein